MEIIRNNTSEHIPINILTYDTFFKRFRGLMFKRTPIKHEGILIIPCNSVHMFFMFFAIDVIFIDQHNSVVKTVSNLKPWRVVPPIKQAIAAIELPKGTINKYNISTGVKIKA